MSSRFFFLLAYCILSALHHFIASFHESHAWHIFDRIDTETEAVCELVVEPIPEPQAGEQQENTVEPISEEVANPADLQGKPRSISLILITPCYIKVLCIYVRGIEWNHRCIILITQCPY